MTSARGTPMAIHLSGSGDDSIVEQSKFHSPWKVYPPWQYDLLTEIHGKQNVKLVYVVRHAEGWHNVNQDYKSIKNLDAELTPLGENQCHKLRDHLLLLAKEVGENENIVGDDTTVERNSRSGRDRYEQGLEYLMNGSEKPRSDEIGVRSDNSDICVLVSPLTRCIQTALLAFDFWTPATSPDKQNDNRNAGNRVPFFGLEALRETVNYNCDRRRRISEIADEFPHVDFSFCKDDEDEIWRSYRKRQKDQSMNENDRVDTTKSVEKNYLESAELYVVADRGRQALEFLQSLSESKIVMSTHSAYLRCILNWGQRGGVPRMFEQRLDDREDPTRQDKLFDYCYQDDDYSDKAKTEIDRASFEEYMRKDYENAEMRSFCLIVQ